MPLMRVFLFSCLCMLSIPACSYLAGNILRKPLKKFQDSHMGQAVLIGSIEMVNPEQNYVLIHCDSRPMLNAGVELIALDANGQQSKLVVTPERKDNYLTADIKEGMPSVGNLALQKIHASDTLSIVPSAPLAQPNNAAKPIESPIARPPPIPEIQFPSQQLPSSRESPRSPTPLGPTADPSTLPPTIR